MKAINSIKVIAISAVASLILVGCGGSGSSAAGTTPGTSSVGTTISGTAIDPEIQGANVYLDTNENGKYDAGELNTTTDNLGKYSLTIPDADIGKSIICEGGIDRVTKADFKGKLKMISRAQKAEQFITPLTTLVQESRANDPKRPLSQIRDEVATKLGLANTDDLDKDTFKNKNLLKIALRIQKIAQKISDANGKDISSVYRRLAGKLSTVVDFDTAIRDTINSDVNKSSFDYERALDLDRELKNLDDSALNSEELALTMDNIDNNITASKTKIELDIDIYKHADIIVSGSKAVKELQDRKVLERLGFKDLSDAVKQKIIKNTKLNFKNDLIDDIKEKISKNLIGLDLKDMREIDREDLFNKTGLKDMNKELKKKLKDRLDNENFDFAKASIVDLESKLKDSNFVSALPADLATDLEDKLSSMDAAISIGMISADGTSLINATPSTGSGSTTENGDSSTDGASSTDSSSDSK